MARGSPQIRVLLETGAQRAFATAIDWPGWSRSGRSEAAALENLAAYAKRYRRAAIAAKLEFPAAIESHSLHVLARVKGTTTTDFGAPDAVAPGDDQPLRAEELGRWLALLDACWHIFEHSLAHAAGKPLATGPRGGGRTREEIAQHVLEAQAGYLARLGWAFKVEAAAPLAAEMRRAREQTQIGLQAAARGEIPARGPRGGLRWTSRFFLRRAAWHLLDHAWEIDDRSNGPRSSSSTTRKSS
jgi:hypothetical protein